MLEFCRDRQADVLRFTTDTSVWPTNNICERGVRPLKTQQKISGRLTSDDVTQDRLDIRGYIDTARKHGLGAYEVLHQLMLGNPWLPPAQPISPYALERLIGQGEVVGNYAGSLAQRLSQRRLTWRHALGDQGRRAAAPREPHAKRA